MGKNVNFAKLRRGLGDEFMLACKRVDPPVEALHRLVTPQGHGTMDEMVRLAVAAWLAEQPQPSDAGHPVGDHPYRNTPTNRVELPAEHYRVRVTYAPLPSLEALKAEFGQNNVSDIFDGRPFELHSSCADMDKTPGDRIFYMHNVGRKWRGEERIAWGLKQRSAVAPNGYRPAIPEEEYEFQKAHPELVDYVALGSSAMRDEYGCCATLWGRDGQRIFGGGRIGNEFDARFRVLFVSK